MTPETWLDETRMADDKKTRRRPGVKPGELKACWYGPRDAREVYVIRDEHAVPEVDSLLLIYHFLSPRWDHDYGTWRPSLAQELHDRGFDLTTLRFSVERREGAPMFSEKFVQRAKRGRT